MGGNAVLNGNNYFVLSKFNKDGDRDLSYGIGGYFIYNTGTVTYQFSNFKQRADNNVQVVVASSSDYYGPYNSMLFLVDPNGNQAVNFGVNGIVKDTFSGGNSYHPLAFKIDFQSDGKMIVGGTYLRRYYPDGVLDTSFHSTQTSISNFLVLHNDKILICKDETSLIRLYASGINDSSFGSKGSYTPSFQHYYKTNSFTEERLTNKIIVALYTYFGYGNGYHELATKRIKVFESGVWDSLSPLPTINNILEKSEEIPLQDLGYLLPSYTTGYDFNDYSDAQIKRSKTNGSIDTLFGTKGNIFDLIAIPSPNNNASIVYYGISKYTETRFNWIRNKGDTVYFSRLNVPSIPYVNVTADKLNPGFGDTVHLSPAVIINPQNYQWFIQPNSYSYIQGTDSTSANPVLIFHKGIKYNISLNAYFDSTPVTVIKNDFINVSGSINFTANKTNVKFSDTLRFQSTANGWPTGYKWNFGTPYIRYLSGTDSSSVKPVIQYTTGGSFDVQLTVMYADTILLLLKTQYINVLPSTGIASFNVSSLNLYPNPTYTTITIEASEPLLHTECEVYDMQGRMHQKHIANVNDHWVIDLPEPPGIYMLKVKTADGKQWVRKVLKE